MDKIAGANQALKQYAMYLYQAYRESGMAEKDAKAAVAEHLVELQSDFAATAGLQFRPPVKPGPLLDECIRLAKPGPNRRLYEQLVNLKLAVVPE